MLLCILVPDAGIVAGRRRVRRRARRLGSVARTSPRQRDIGVGERDHVWTMPRQRNRASDRIRRRQGIGIICVQRGRCWLRYEWRVRENARRGCCRRGLRRIGGWSRRSRRCGGRCLGKGGDLDIRRGRIAGAVAHPVAPSVIRCSGVGRRRRGLRRCGRRSWRISRCRVRTRRHSGGRCRERLG